MFIKFNVNSLRDRLKILTIFSPDGTLWCNGQKCEIVVISKFKCCIVIPFLSTDITDLQAFYICHEKISELALKNSIANTITLNFEQGEIFTEENIFENNINIVEPKYTNITSISQPQSSNSITRFCQVSRREIEFKPTELDNIISDTLRIKKHESGDLTIGYTSYDNYKTNIKSYNMNINTAIYNNVSAIFKIKFEVLNDFIRKLITTRAASIELEILKDAIKFKAYGSVSVKDKRVDELFFYCSIIQYKQIVGKYKMLLDNFSLLKKINISISDVKAKDKKIYKYIQFNVISQGEKIIGLCIYPGYISKNFIDDIKNYFIFMPVEDY